MARFQYKAVSNQGDIVTGVIDAGTQAAVVQQLQDLGHVPLQAREIGRSGFGQWFEGVRHTQDRPSLRELGAATQQLATLLQAGLPLDRSIEILITVNDGGRLRSILQRVLDRVRDGVALANALAECGEAFPRLYIGIVRAGELGGSLHRNLAQLAELLSKSQAIREAVRSALVYPAILLVTVGLSIGMILVFVMPQLRPLFDAAGKGLPAAATIVLGIADFIGAYWWLLALITVAVAATVSSLLRRPEVRLRWDVLILRLPLFGDLVTKIETARFGRTLGTLLQSGLPLPAALGITKSTIDNSAIAEAVAGVAETLKEGEALTATLSRTRLFPALALQFVRVGEESGRLEEMLLQQAEIYDQQVQQSIQRLLIILPPLLTVILGAIVAGIIASLLLAILSVNDLAL